MKHTPAIYSGSLYGNTFTTEFPSNPEVSIARGGYIFTLLKDFQFTFCLDTDSGTPIYPSDKEKRNYVICTVTVPAEFKTNLISSPKPFWPILPPFGKGCWSSIVHDYMYTYNLLKPDGTPFTKKDCDQIFHIGILSEGMNKIKAHTSYRLLRAVGVHAWRDAKEEAAQN